MRLTLLGVYGPFPAPNGGCSSYLVEDGDTRILLDCGSGASGRLRMIHPELPLSLDAIVLSHMHADHAGELDLFRYMLEFGMIPGPLKIFSPETNGLQYPVFETVQSTDGLRAEIGSLTLEFSAVRHAVPTTGVRITDKAGHALFYTGDTCLFDGLADAAKNADLLLADACLRDERNGKALKNHMTVAQAVLLRRDANCRRAVLTHRFADGIAYPEIGDPCSEYAAEGAVYEI
jgi:ribonuclease BN (tRNA processing enzyme)